MTGNMTNSRLSGAASANGRPRLAAAFDELILNPQLFQRVKAVYDARESAGLNAQQQRVVTRLYDQFVRRGANLDAAQKQQLTDYNQELARLFAQFGEKVLADERTHIVATEAELAGVPADVKAAAAAAARERNLPAGQFAIVNTRSAVDPILTFADDRALARARVARLRQPRRQWRRQRHQPDDPRDRPAARRAGAAARLREPCRMADAGHDGRARPTAPRS